ncbi:biotin transporter BioY [Flexistipes sp.]|uniref:biotin transporter BioY n=1 Tax=Flexistipes sp. TaxID=3088135 RepID=UPI002E1F31E3|nr:biotin transporter BioY [Flexistipes sp.]
MKIESREKRVAYAGMIVALMAVSAFMKIPLPTVPITFQPLVVMLVPMVFGVSVSFIGMFLYLLLGLIGLPIFAHGGGIAYVLNPTFGYLVGFVVSSVVIGYISDKAENIKGFISGGLLGLIIIYFLGVCYLFININYIQDKPMSMMTALKIGFFIPIWLDLVKLVVAAFIAGKVRKIIK